MFALFLGLRTQSVAESNAPAAARIFRVALR